MYPCGWYAYVWLDLADGLLPLSKMLAAAHSEPSNALSFPTWMVHVSSLIEWLAAMTYVWR